MNFIGGVEDLAARTSCGFTVMVERSRRPIVAMQRSKNEKKILCNRNRIETRTGYGNWWSAHGDRRSRQTGRVPLRPATAAPVLSGIKSVLKRMPSSNRWEAAVFNYRNWAAMRTHRYLCDFTNTFFIYFQQNAYAICVTLAENFLKNRSAVIFKVREGQI